MISKEAIDFISGRLNVKQKGLIEKDMILHRLLAELFRQSAFKGKYAFKGGTCLIKCYLGYYRFSEDLDFTWIDQGIFTKKTEKETRKIISGQISVLAEALESIAKSIGMDFRAEKNNNRFIEFGGSNKFVTFKLWYRSQETEEAHFIKIQINYAEYFAYRIMKAIPQTICKGLNKEEVLFLYPELKWLFEKLELHVYDIREILVEKARAILTRLGSKARDFIDIYMIQKHQGINIESFEHIIIEKTVFMLKYEKYRKNLQDKRNPPMFRLGQEHILLLKPLESDFPASIKILNKFIEHLVAKLLDIEVHKHGRKQN